MSRVLTFRAKGWLFLIYSKQKFTGGDGAEFIGGSYFRFINMLRANVHFKVGEGSWKECCFLRGKQLERR